MGKKWVYLFDELKEVESYVGGSWDAVRGLLGGKGANLAEMIRIRVPVPPGFTITTEACNDYLAHGGAFPEGMWDQAIEGAGAGGGPYRQALRGRPEPAAGLLPLRRQVLDAGHDGHGPQHRAERRDQPGHDRPHRQPALRLRLLPPPDPDVRRGRHGDPGRRLRGGAHPRAAQGRRQDRPRAHRRAAAGGHRGVQEDLPAPLQPRLPGRALRAAAPGHGRRLRVLERQARDRLPQRRRDRPRPGHGRQHRDHGLRQHGRRLAPPALP